MEHITIEDFHKVIKEKGVENVNVVDVRKAEKYRAGHIEGAINLPLSTLEDHLDILDKEKHYYVICQAERFSRQGTEILNNNGFKATNVTAGMDEYPGKTVTDS